ATVRANTMNRKTRSNKRGTTCERCGRECSTPQKLREHLKRKNPCKPLQDQKKIADGVDDPKRIPLTLTLASSTQISNQISIQKGNQQVKQKHVQAVNQKHKKGVVAEIRKEIFTESDTPIQTSDPGEHFMSWRARLQKSFKNLVGINPTINNLDDCKGIYHYLSKNEPSSQTSKEKTNNEEFECLGKITEEGSEKDLEFREQEELVTAVKRRAIAVHRAKVPRLHPDNGSDIRKMLESQRKQFKELLEKEFDKHGQFKFALCSLTKFLIDDKPGNEKQGKRIHELTGLEISKL
ncbi:17435_t:CDS:2, partial [Acaulospora morrowiae]